MSRTTAPLSRHDEEQFRRLFQKHGGPVANEGWVLNKHGLRCFLGEFLGGRMTAFGSNLDAERLAEIASLVLGDPDSPEIGPMSWLRSGIADLKSRGPATDTTDTAAYWEMIAELESFERSLRAVLADRPPTDALPPPGATAREGRFDHVDDPCSIDFGSGATLLPGRCVTFGDGLREAARLIQLWQSSGLAKAQIHSAFNRDASRIVSSWPARLREVVPATDDAIAASGLSGALELPLFPVMLRKTWSGGEVQAWIDTNIKPLIGERRPDFDAVGGEAVRLSEEEITAALEAFGDVDVDNRINREKMRRVLVRRAVPSVEDAAKAGTCGQWKPLPFRLSAAMRAAMVRAAREYMERTGGNSPEAMYEAAWLAAAAPSGEGGSWSEEAPTEPVKPIALMLYCPRCGTQHIDAPEAEMRTPFDSGADIEYIVSSAWTNPPHRSHKCRRCECIWRPADVPTTGVARIATSGKADTWPRECAVDAPTAHATVHGVVHDGMAAPVVIQGETVKVVLDALSFYADGANFESVTFKDGERERQLARLKKDPSWSQYGEDSRGHEQFCENGQRAEDAIRSLELAFRNEDSFIGDSYDEFRAGKVAVYTVAANSKSSVVHRAVPTATCHASCAKVDGAPSEVGATCLEKLRPLMVRLGVYPGDGQECFAANLESNLYSLARATNGLLDALLAGAAGQGARIGTGVGGCSNKWDGEGLPPVGCEVLFDTASSGTQTGTVTGYSVMGHLGGDQAYHRVFVELVYAGTAIPNRRLLKDVRPGVARDDRPSGTAIAQAGRFCIHDGPEDELLALTGANAAMRVPGGWELVNSERLDVIRGVARQRDWFEITRELEASDLERSGKVKRVDGIAAPFKAAGDKEMGS